MGREVVLIQLRLPSESYERMRRLAEEHEISLNRLVLRSLRHFGRCGAAEDRSEDERKQNHEGREHDGVPSGD